MFSFYPILPLWLIFILLILSVSAAVFSYRHRNPAVTPGQHNLLLALRILSLLTVLFMLLCPGKITEDLNEEKSHIVFLVDQSASMSARDLPYNQSRLEHAVAFLNKNQFQNLKKYPFATYSFNSDTRLHTTADDLQKLEAEGGTDIQQAIARIDRDIGLNNTSAILLISDGLDDSGFKGSDISTPLLSVQTGTDISSVPDLGIEPFKYPSRISAGEELIFEIPVMMHGYPDTTPGELNVFADNTLIHSASLSLNSGQLCTEKVRTSLPETGIHTITITCTPLQNEVTTLNNRRELAVEVVEARDEIALYFPLLNNSFRPLLREFLKNTKGRFTAVYKVHDTLYRIRGNNINPVFNNGLPPKAERLKNINCIILGSHNKELLTYSEALILEEYVSSGGTLITLAGSDSYGNIAPGSPILRLLPVIPIENSFLPGKQTVETEPSADHAFSEQIREIIRDNPDSIDFSLASINRIGGLKAAAKVLLWAEADSKQPLIVWHPYGRGKVISLLSNSFHLWGSPVTRSSNFSRLWRQLIAFARNPDDNADILNVALAKTELADGEETTITATVLQPTDEEAPPEKIRENRITVKADIFRLNDSSPLTSIQLEKKKEHFTALLPGQPPGRYIIRVTSRTAKELLRTRYLFLVVGEIIRENSRIKSSRETFRNLSSEKHIFTTDEPERIEEKLRETLRKNSIQREQYLIFETPFFFVTILLLLLAEWFLRRRFNLF